MGTVKKNGNVLLHLAGYFKKMLSADEKRELLEIIDRYRQEYVPLIENRDFSTITHHRTPYRQD